MFRKEKILHPKSAKAKARYEVVWSTPLSPQVFEQILSALERKQKYQLRRLVQSIELEKR